MSLGKPKKQTDDFFGQLAKEEDLTIYKGAPGTPAAAEVEVKHDNVHVVVEEFVLVQLDRDGTVKKVDVKGEMKLSIYDPDQARIVVHTNGSIANEKQYKCRLHPKINKNLWAKEGKLTLQDANGRFPCGSENAPIILKWRMQCNEESEVPLTLNFWPNVEDGRTVVSVELRPEKELQLQNVVVSIPCRSSEHPVVKLCSGDHLYDPKQGVLSWRAGAVDADANTLEFSVPEMDGDGFFPISINFTSTSTFSGLVPQGVSNVETGAAVPFTHESSLKVEKFVIE
jgi:hypothetical protein